MRMGRSSMVVYVVGRSPSLYNEFLNAQRLGVLSRCLFVFPPVDFTELRARLTVFAAASGLPRGALPPIDAHGRQLVGAYIDDDGHAVGVGVNGRDDLAYQTLLTVAAAMLIPRGDKQVRCATGPGPAAPDPDVVANMVKFDPHRDYSTRLTVRWGMIYLFLMAPGVAEPSTGRTDDCRSRSLVSWLWRRSCLSSDTESFLGQADSSAMVVRTTSISLGAPRSLPVSLVVT